MSRRKKDFDEEIQYDGAGREIHIFDGPLGKSFVKKLSAADWLPTGEQYCPNCHIKLTRLDGYWECGKCVYDISDDDAEAGEGYPTLESTYEDDYGTYYEDDSSADDDEDYNYHEEYE